MLLTPGTRLGPYEISAPLGAGGMGEVYRARDTKLHRDVAIKVMPSLAAGDEDRAVRFQREAHALASMNHPNIAQIHGTDESTGSIALVMELVEGEDLAVRLARGPLPLREAVHIARQVCDALEAAHERGVIHRDLKPANIKVRPDDVVKVLDFGLAKILAGTSPSRAPDPANSPTLTVHGTQTGLVLGTAAYMAPEQARGKELDRRCDIWAFGCVLFEMLTGRAPFEGDTISDVVASILTTAPDWRRLPADAPAPVRRLLRRCLEKDPKRRLRDIADARLELDAVADGSEAEGLQAAPPSRRIAWAVLLIGAGVAGAALVWMLGSDVAQKDARQYTVPRAGFSEFALTAISPDGRYIAFAPALERGPYELYLLGIDSLEPRLVGTSSGTALAPFFSPDSRWLAYFNDEHLVKVSVTGGPSVNVMPTGPQRLTGAWGSDGSIVVASAVLGGHIQNGLTRVSPDGRLEPFTIANEGEVHHEPHFTADGRFVLFTVRRGQSFSIAAVPAAGGSPRALVSDARSPRHSPTGHLIFQHPGSGDLFALPFDARGETGSERVRIGTAATIGQSAAFAVSREGTLIYSAPADTALDEDATLVRVDRAGTMTPLMEERGSWAQPRFSPGGRAVLFRAIQVPDCHLWVFDLERGTRTRITTEADNHDPIWYSDGLTVSWTASASGMRKLLSTRIDVDRAPQTILSDDKRRWRAQSWSADGTRLLLTAETDESDQDLYVLEAGAEEPRPLLTTRFREGFAAFSPDGRWLAYVSNESGRDEVYVRRFDGEPQRMQISANGGMFPRWSGDGLELFYTEGSRMMAADVRLGETATAGRPRQLFEGPFEWDRADNWDVSPDGRGFVMVLRQRATQATLRVVVNWPQQLLR